MKNPLRRQADIEPAGRVRRLRAGGGLPLGDPAAFDAAPDTVWPGAGTPFGNDSRPFSHPVTPPSACHLFAAFYASRGLGPRSKEFPHDRFGSRRSYLRHAGARPEFGAG